MKNTIEKNKHTWDNKDIKPSDFIEEIFFFIKKRLLTLQSKNNLICIFGNNLLEKKIMLK